MDPWMQNVSFVYAVVQAEDEVKELAAVHGV